MILFADIPGERLDAFLARCADNLSRSAAQKLMEKGAVTIAGRPVKKNEKTALDALDQMLVDFHAATGIDAVSVRYAYRSAEEQQELVRLCAKGNRELLAIQKEVLEGRK